MFKYIYTHIYILLKRYAIIDRIHYYIMYKIMCNLLYTACLFYTAVKNVSKVFLKAEIGFITSLKVYYIFSHLSTPKMQ